MLSPSSIANYVPARVVRVVAKSRLLKGLLRPLINLVLPRHLEIVTVRDGAGAGLRIWIDPQTEKFYWSGGHEAHVQAVLAEYLKPGMSVWDVGAHIGFFALIASRLVGGEGEVIAFEPLGNNRRRLVDNVTLNAAHVSIRSEALGARSGRGVMRDRTGSSLMWELVDSGDGVDVDVATLNELAGLRAPDLVKIDAEGHELDVLRGGIKLINRQRPVLLLEFQDPDEIEAAARLLTGYTFRALGGDHWVAVPSSGS